MLAHCALVPILVVPTLPRMGSDQVRIKSPCWVSVQSQFRLGATGRPDKNVAAFKRGSQGYACETSSVDHHEIYKKIVFK